VDITRRTYVTFEVADEVDDEEIRGMARAEAELADWDDDPPEGVSCEVVEEC
jgi:hypothetical protein